MNPVVLYFAKVSGAMALFYLCYKLFLSNDTYFNRNRFYFLGGMVIAIAVPFIKITVRTIEVQPVPQFAEPLQTQIITQNITENSSIWPDVLAILLVIYLLGVTFFIIRMLLAYTQAIRIIGRSERSKFYELVLALTAQAVAPFSMFKWLVIPKNTTNQSDFENIVQHESIHSRQFHSVDLLLAEIITAFQWFNPFVWMMKRAIIENHEYIVDKTLLTNGVDAREYQYSLLSYVTAGSGQLAVANHFNVNLLKKRISMMNKNKSPQWHALKNGLVLLAVTIVVAFSATFETKVIAQSTGNEPMVIINGKKSDNRTLQAINPEKIKQVNVFRDSLAIAKYGKEAKNGVIEVEADAPAVSSASNMDDVHVTGYGTQIHVVGYADSSNRNYKEPVLVYRKKADPKDSVKGIQVRKAGDLMAGFEYRHNDTKQPIQGPLFIIDGKVASSQEMSSINPETILSIEILKDEVSTSKYGPQGANGVVVVILKDNANTKPESPVSKSEKELTLAPNPTSDNVQVSLGADPKGTCNVKVYSKFGELVYQDKKTGSPFTISVAGWKTGVYIVVVEDGTDIYKGSLSVVH